MSWRSRGGRFSAQVRDPFFQISAVAAAGQVAHARERQASAPQRDSLFRQRKGVPQRSVCLTRKLPEGFRLRGDILAAADVFKTFDHIRDGDAVKGDVLAARTDRDRHLMRLRGGQQKDYVRGRLFQRLEQRVEGRLREHVDFVNNVNFIF